MEKSGKGRGNEASAARLVASAWRESDSRNTDGNYSVEVDGTEVILSHIEHGTDGDHEWVDVWLGEHVGSPDVRIINPATEVQDRNGPIKRTVVDERGSERSVAFREDPVQAVADLIAEIRSGT